MSGILTDVIEAIFRAKSKVEKFFKGVAPDGASLSQRAKDTILMFPIISTNQISSKVLDVVYRNHQLRMAEYLKMFLNLDKILASDISVNNIPTLITRKLAAVGKTARNESTNIAKLVEATSTYMQANLGELMYEMMDYSMDEATKTLLESSPIENIIPIGSSLINEAPNMLGTNSLNTFNSTAATVRAEKAEELNALRPTLIDIDFVIVSATDDNKVVELRNTVKVTVAVKSSLHILDSSDIILGLGQAYKNNSLLFRFFKARSGEISFFKEFILNVDRIKDSVLATNKTSSILEKMRNQAMFRKSKKFIDSFSSNINTKVVLPHTSIVVSMEEVTRIEVVYGFNLLNQAKKFLADFNFLCLYVIDEARGTIYIFEDGDCNPSEYSLNELVLVNQKSGNEIKDVFNILSKRV